MQEEHSDFPSQHRFLYCDRMFHFNCLFYFSFFEFRSILSGFITRLVQRCWQPLSFLLVSYRWPMFTNVLFMRQQFTVDTLLNGHLPLSMVVHCSSPRPQCLVFHHILANEHCVFTEQICAQVNSMSFLMAFCNVDVYTAHRQR